MGHKMLSSPNRATIPMAIHSQSEMWPLLGPEAAERIMAGPYPASQFVTGVLSASG